MEQAAEEENGEYFFLFRAGSAEKHCAARRYK